MKDLPAYLYILLFIIGIILNFISLHIAYKNFPVQKFPLWLTIPMAIFGNLGMLAIFPLTTTHIGLYFILNTIIFYAAIWRSNIWPKKNNRLTTLIFEWTMTYPFIFFSYLNLILSILFVFYFTRNQKMTLTLHILFYYLIFSSLLLSILFLTQNGS